MNREIKFRYYSAPQGKMVEWGDIMKLHVHTVFKMLQPECVLMQYTGLKDKNGVEIYEGDIVNFFCDGDNLNFVVSMIKGACFAAHRKSNDSDFYFLDDFEYSVVGNIYENPELLNP